VALPARDSFTPGEAAKLLGVSGAAFRAAVKRLNLPATGNGKARTFPRSTVEALVLNRGKGCGPETLNHYTRAVRGFFRWLVKAKRIGSNPLESLTSALSGNLRVVGGSRGDLTQPLEMTGAGASQHRPASLCTSEGDGTRTRNHRIDSPVL
jgi:excisionase family DNA binding protein